MKTIRDALIAIVAFTYAVLCTIVRIIRFMWLGS